jgi:hypothetical protein
MVRRNRVTFEHNIYAVMPNKKKPSLLHKHIDTSEPVFSILKAGAFSYATAACLADHV